MRQNPRWDGGLTCALSVKDLNAAVEWYSSVLGFQLMYAMEEIG